MLPRGYPGPTARARRYIYRETHSVSISDPLLHQIPTPDPELQDPEQGLPRLRYIHNDPLMVPLLVASLTATDILLILYIPIIKPKGINTMMCTSH